MHIDRRPHSDRLQMRETLRGGQVEGEGEAVVPLQYSRPEEVREVACKAHLHALQRQRTRYNTLQSRRSFGGGRLGGQNCEGDRNILRRLPYAEQRILLRSGVRFQEYLREEILITLCKYAFGRLLKDE